MHGFFTVLALTFATLPVMVAAAIWVGGPLIYYGSTMFGEPEHNGAAPLRPLWLRMVAPCMQGCPAHPACHPIAFPSSLHEPGPHAERPPSPNLSPHECRLVTGCGLRAGCLVRILVACRALIHCLTCRMRAAWSQGGFRTGCLVRAPVACRAPTHCITFRMRAGWREWPAFRAWFARNLTPALNSWMGDVDVVYDGDDKLDPARRYVFGYAPHGLFPIGGAHCKSASYEGFPHGL